MVNGFGWKGIGRSSPLDWRCSWNSSTNMARGISWIPLRRRSGSRSISDDFWDHESVRIQQTVVEHQQAVVARAIRGSCGKHDFMDEGAALEQMEQLLLNLGVDETLASDGMKQFQYFGDFNFFEA